MPISDLKKLVGNSRKRQDLLKEFSLPGLTVDNVALSPEVSALSNGGTLSGTVDDQVAQLGRHLSELQAAQNSRINELIAAAAGFQSTLPRTSSAGSSANSGSGILSSLFGGVLGLSPVLQGLFSLFGGSSAQAVQPLVPFELPTAINYEGGLSASSPGVVPVDYGQGGQLRPLQGGNGSHPNQTVQIQVNAIDSRSFLDHSDEIAHAVRQALLNSNSLSDVITDL